MIKLKDILLEDSIHIGYPELIYYDNENTVLGYITYEEYKGIPDVKYIEVDKAHRREGIAYKLIQALNT